jgi:hypothetical protein
VNARLRPLGFRPVDLEPAVSEQILVGDTIDLDGRRGMAAQKATRLRRQLSMVYAADAALRQEELDILLAAAPATGWGEAVAKARYLLILFAQTPAAEDPRRATLIADVFADFKRLLAESKHPPAAGDAEKESPRSGDRPGAVRAGQRLGSGSLTRGNVNGSHSPGNNTPDPGSNPGPSRVSGVIDETSDGSNHRPTPPGPRYYRRIKRRPRLIGCPHLTTPDNVAHKQRLRQPVPL